MIDLNKLVFDIEYGNNPDVIWFRKSLDGVTKKMAALSRRPSFTIPDWLP
jgi:hypothetical protein